jgi:hypothetical protein
MAAVGADPGAPRYSAFISYSHRDAAFARRLHRRLESYRLPRRLRAPGESAPGSRRLRPLFRDLDEMTAAADLTSAVRAAIAQSACLIVICSPSAAASPWVGREVELFRALHGDTAILAALHQGTPATAFPAALRAPGPEGRPLEPLAADFTGRGHGARLALLKLVAALAGVGLDELVHRDAQRRIRQAAAVSLAAVAGMAGAGLLALAAVRARAAAESERARGERVIDFLLTDLRSRLKAVGRLDVLDAVNQGALGYYQGQDLAHLPPRALLQRSVLLQAIVEDDEKRGDLAAATAQAAEAERTTAQLLLTHPRDPREIYAHAQSEYWSGLVSWRLGDDDRAQAKFTAYQALARRLVAVDPANPDWRREAGYADSNLGMFTLRRSADTTRAGEFFRASLADFQAAARRRPAEPDIQHAIADAYAWLADIERLRGDYPGALANRLTQRRILQAMLAGDPRDFQTQTALIGNALALARIAAAGGDLAGAADELRADHDAALALARADPQNKAIAKQVRIIELFQARTWLAMPASQRPPPAVIAATLGDCAAEHAKPNNTELATFCTILEARRLAQAGDKPGASALLATVRSSAVGRDRLTERWLLNFQDEINLDASARAPPRRP